MANVVDVVHEWHLKRSLGKLKLVRLCPLRNRNRHRLVVHKTSKDAFIIFLLDRFLIGLRGPNFRILLSRYPSLQATYFNDTILSWLLGVASNGVVLHNIISAVEATLLLILATKHCISVVVVGLLRVPE